MCLVIVQQIRVRRIGVGIAEALHVIVGQRAKSNGRPVGLVRFQFQDQRLQQLYRLPQFVAAIGQNAVEVSAIGLGEIGLRQQVFEFGIFPLFHQRIQIRLVFFAAGAGDPGLRAYTEENVRG